MKNSFKYLRNSIKFILFCLCIPFINCYFFNYLFFYNQNNIILKELFNKKMQKCFKTSIFVILTNFLIENC